MKPIFLIVIMFLVSCSNEIQLRTQQVSFDFPQEYISDLKSTKEQIRAHMQGEYNDEASSLFDHSWVSVLTATNNFQKELHLHVTEHQPLAFLGKGKYLTQEGRIISPGKRKEDLNIIQVTGSEEEAEDLLNFALELQKTLNLGNKSILSIEHKGSGFMEAIDSLGGKYSFTKKDFRAQLERLEDYILFELSSGSIDNIRYIDLRYKNALAVGYKNMEKTI